MCPSTLLLPLPSLFLSPTAANPPSASSSASPIEALTQAGYKTAWLIDSQNYTAFNQVMTADIVYDSTDLGPYGGKTTGLEQTVETVATIKAARTGARTSQLVKNLLVLDLINPEEGEG